MSEETCYCLLPPCLPPSASLPSAFCLLPPASCLRLTTYRLSPLHLLSLNRRFGALGIEVGGWKQTDKGKEEWGEIRTGTKSELLLDIRAILQKAIDDVDDVAMHNENTLTQNKTEGLLFPKAVRSLAAAAARYLPQLKATLEKTTDEKERGLIIASIEHCEAILDSVTKLPPETKPEKKKGKS